MDLQLLSQSELYTLSLCSPSTFDPRRCDDVVIPKIDRSVFNESAGSRKQTYSRLRLAPASGPAATASASSIRHRTPHLRPSTHNPQPLFLDADPENVENRQIVSLLKELFGVECSATVKDDNVEELVPVQVDYSETVPMPQLANVVLTGQKRKRGRPRKNESALYLVETKVESQSDINVSAGTNNVVVYDNLVDKDKEVVNGDGFNVNLIELGLMEDPYGEELNRRTQGLGTEEQLLEFLKGLNGQWGSRRKKKRIVDASLFGNALPKGWRLLLSCKRKEGRVWLFCRRYISPNGRQFESCKEISAYLSSLHGIQDANQPTNFQGTAGIVAVDEMMADLSVPNEKWQENPQCQTFSPGTATISGNYEVQITMNPGDLPAVQVRETAHCDKCSLTFNSQDDFLQHQLSSHRRRRTKNGESITDGVIIKGGKYECQFCHKTFDERHRYNGHVGTHIRSQAKNYGSQVADVVECVGSGSVDPLPQGNPAVQPSIGLERNAELVRKSANDPSNDTDKENGDAKEITNRLGTVDNSMGVDVAKSNLCFDSNPVFSNNVNNNETSGGANATKNTGNEVGMYGNALEKSSSPSPLNNNQIDGNTNIITHVAETKAVSHTLSERIEICEIHLSGSNFTHTMDDLRLEENKVVDSEKLFGFCNRNAGLEDSSAVGDKRYAESEDHSYKNIGTLNCKSVPIPTGSEQKTCSGDLMLTPANDKEENKDRDGCIFPSSMLVGDEHNNTGAYRSMGCESNKCVKEHKGIHISRVVPSWNETSNVSGKFEKEVPIGIIDAPEHPKNPDNSVPSLSGFEQSYGVQEYINKAASSRKIQEPHMSDAQNMRSNELFFPFSSSNEGIGMDSVNNNKHERGFEFRAFFPSENAKVFSAENSRTNVQKHEREESKKEQSGSVLLAQHCIAQPSSEVYNMNKIFGSQVDERKINVIGHAKSHELCLAFDSQPNSGVVELKKFGTKSYDMQSGTSQTYGAQSNLNNADHLAPKEGRAYGFDLHDSSFSGKTNVFENNFNMVYPGRVWEGPKLDEVGNSGSKFMAGFGGGVSQPVEDVLAGSIWRTGEENLLRPDLTDASTPLIQSSNSFHTFDIISDKGHEGLFGVNHKYDCDSSFEGLTLGRSEPMEYSFMTVQSSNPLPDETKGFSFNADTQQGFDSSFWLGKESLMQNITAQNQVATLCVWCRNEFYQDAAATSGAQTGAIGSMCPACSSRISQQFNVL